LKGYLPSWTKGFISSSQVVVSATVQGMLPANHQQ
jgi:hypothetical protein